MTGEPDLKSAYALNTPEDAKRLYATWAETYDSDFGDAQGYLMPREVVRMFVAAGGQGPVLDVGAGTGLVGEGLAAAGVGPIDALDLSNEMLSVAKSKGVYRKTIAADVTQPLSAGPYSGIISAGTFTMGHVGPEGIPPLLEIAKSGCLFVISVNAKHFESAGFEAFFAKLDTEIDAFSFEDVRIYSDKADLSHRYDIGRIVRFRKA
ncbi:MAG: class I SAM-dependent methyltransferase [Octadecabacter sp.]|nr:class I SAM-dependent methyltransferase [Octadecabacter sp.]